MKIKDEAVGVNEDALRALAQAYDREDAAQHGESDPWNLDDPGDIGDSDTWVSERLACARAAAEAFLSTLTMQQEDLRHFMRKAETAEARNAELVKPLEWMDADEGMCTKWRAAALGGHYDLVDFGKDDPGFAVNFYWGRPLSFWFIQGEPDERGPTGPKIFPTLEEAKAAAQADYERRVLSCLSVETEGVEPDTNSPTTDEMVERIFQATVPFMAGTAYRELRTAITAALSSEAHNGRG